MGVRESCCCVAGTRFGPAGAPLGFFRRAPAQGATPPPAPPNLAADPIQTIAVVRAVDRAYDISYLETVQLDAHAVYHLRLRPLRNPQQYPLRELWIDTTTYDVIRLTYAWPYNGTTANITYDFAPVGTQRLWTIVHIDAQATSHNLFASHTEHVSEDCTTSRFPRACPTTTLSRADRRDRDAGVFERSAYRARERERMRTVTVDANRLARPRARKRECLRNHDLDLFDQRAGLPAWDERSVGPIAAVGKDLRNRAQAVGARAEQLRTARKPRRSRVPGQRRGLRARSRPRPRDRVPRRYRAHRAP